jgi:hypothetical protein
MIIFTASRPDGITGKDDLLRLDRETLICVEETGVAHTTCFCCGLKIVVKPDSAILTDEDRAYLIEGEKARQ